jgi:hypothetical protein
MSSSTTKFGARAILYKARRANPPLEKMSKFTRKKQEYLLACADWTVSVLNDPEVVEFAELMLTKEGIPLGSVRDVRVMVLPPIYRVRGILHGTLHLEARQVSLYPVLPQHGGFKRAADRYVHSWNEVIADDATREKLTSASIETLLHELLHLKYPNKESLVRTLAARYHDEFEEFVKFRNRTLTGPDSKK